MKLVSLSFKATPRMPGLRPGELSHIDCDKPGGALIGWRIVLRGQQVFFVSPPGWSRDESVRRDPNGASIVFEVPRTEVCFQWKADPGEHELLFKCSKWESPPLGWQPAPVAPEKSILEQIPANQIGD